MASETLQLAETKSGGGERQPRCQWRWRCYALRCGQVSVSQRAACERACGGIPGDQVLPEDHGCDKLFGVLHGILTGQTQQDPTVRLCQTQVLLHISSQEQIFALDSTKFFVLDSTATPCAWEVQLLPRVSHFPDKHFLLLLGFFFLS